MSVRCSFLDTEIDGSNPAASVFVSLSKAFNPNCFNRLSYEMSTRREEP